MQSNPTDRDKASDTRDTRIYSQSSGAITHLKWRICARCKRPTADSVQGKRVEDRVCPSPT